MNTPLPPSELAQRQARLEQHFPLQRQHAGAQVFSYRETGTGPLPLVLLHGIGSNSASWFDTAMLLQQEARLIAWDAPGYGHSSCLAPAAPRATDYAEALEGFLEHRGVTACILVGHSLGALMAAAYTWKYNPGRVRHLVLISPARGYGAPEYQQLGAGIRTERIHHVHTLGIEAMATQRSGRLLSPLASQTAQDWVRWNMASLNLPGYLQAIELLCGDDIGQYTQSPVPVSVHCGAADTITPPRDCQDIARQYGTELQIIPQAGHASPVENAPHVAQLLKQTLSEQTLTNTKGKNRE